MNTKRVQTNFLKMLIDESPVYVLKDIKDFPNMVGITEGHAVYFIHETEFFLDKSKMKEVDLESIVQDISKSTLSRRTGVEKKDNSGRKTNLIEIKNEDISIWLDDKFLKEFDDKYASYFATNEFSPVYIKENGILAGLILPVRMRGE